jgi:hypothetical protein
MKKPDIKTEIVLVTPKKAQEYLERNETNRPVNPQRVLAYAKIMKQDGWTENGVIEFGKDGTLYDGQHRLSAVLKSGCSIWMTVKHGLDSRSRSNIDLGRARTVANWLAIIGVRNSTRVAATLRLIHKIQSGTNKGKTYSASTDLFTPEFAEKMLRENPDICSWCSREIYRKVPQGMKPATIAAYSYLFSLKDDALAKDFVSGMADGFDKNKYPAFHKFRELIIRQPSTPTPYPANYLQAFMVMAWNSERSGTPLKIFRWIPTDQDFPEIK